MGESCAEAGAGGDPPPDMPRPALANTRAPDWLEAEIDRHATARGIQARSVLHRLNRTEYAYAIRDSGSRRTDVTTLLPPDDSARGFDNIAGSLTSQTLSKPTQRRGARRAYCSGYWKTQRKRRIWRRRYFAESHIEGLPLGTRGGMMVRHDFPADGEYTFAIQTRARQLYSRRATRADRRRRASASLQIPRGGHESGMAGDQGDGI